VKVNKLVEEHLLLLPRSVQFLALFQQSLQLFLNFLRLAVAALSKGFSGFNNGSETVFSCLNFCLDRLMLG
jgi:hypothetical protein